MRNRILVGLGTAAILLVACGREGGVEPRRPGAGPTAAPPVAGSPGRPIAAAALERFDDCGDVTRTLRERALAYVTPTGLAGASFAVAERATAVALAGAAETDAQSAPAAPAPATGEYSTTNVQEQGVDEPDTVETDGRHIFAVAGGKLHVVSVGDDPRLVASVELAGFANQLLLSGDRLIVIGPDEITGTPVPLPDRPVADIAIAPVMAERTLVRIYDVSDAASPRELSTLRLDGSYVAARAVDGVARVVVRRSQPEIGFVQPQEWTPRLVQKALERNREAVRETKLDAWIPTYSLEARGGSRSGHLSSCTDTFAPPEVSGFGTVTVVTIDPSDPVPREGATVVGGGDIVYASRDALYVTTQRWNAPRPLGDPAVQMPDIAPVDPGTSEIHKFDIRGAEARYVASGAVRGTLLSQWSLSEHQGFLRVASTAGPTFGALPEEVPSSESFVTVLEQRDEVLAEVGRVGGLGRGERIYAVRFIGDVGYVVTFRQVDPLYTLDLSDPTKPRVVGELKIPGYSSYLHPVGDGLVLGIGQDATEDGRVLGTQVSLFDVRDPAAPERLANLTLGGGGSGAEWDHHAFLWWEPRRLAMLPVQLYSFEPAGAPDRGGSFSGAVAIRVDGGVDEIGRISHPATSFEGGVEPFGSPIARSLVAGGALFTVSETGVMQSDLDSLDRRAWVPFPQS